MRTRTAALLLAGAVPWVVVVAGGPGATVSLVTAYGLVTPSPLHITTLPAYLLVHTRGLPPSLLAWPVAALLYALALANLVAGRALGAEDRRLTAGLVVLAGLSLLAVAGSLGRTAGIVAAPTGTAALWAAAWWADRAALVAIARGGDGRER